VAVNKHLLPIYDKPLIYYPLSVLMLTGLREILLISTPTHLPLFQGLLRDGSQWGLQLTYLAQDEPRGVADALLTARDFAAGDSVCLALGDNIFLGDRLLPMLRRATRLRRGALIFASRVDEPRHFGVVEFDRRGRAVGLEERPAQPRTNFAVPGIYFYDEQVGRLAARLEPSGRGELEITDLNRMYLERRMLTVRILDRDVSCLDVGAHATMLRASNLVQTVQERQGGLVGSPEEAAFRMGFIDEAQLARLADAMGKSDYASRLHALLRGDRPPAPESGLPLDVAPR
jgi:glucose-1-phosphate thymidylyltransferase